MLESFEMFGSMRDIKKNARKELKDLKRIKFGKPDSFSERRRKIC